MEIIENGVFKLRRRRRRPMRVDGLSDLEQDLNEARGARVYLKTRETRSYLGTGYDLVYKPDKSFKDQAGKLSDNILTLQGERTRLMAADSYDGRGNDLLKLDEAINQTKKMHNVREDQDMLMGHFKTRLIFAFEQLGGNEYDDLPTSIELRGDGEEQIIRYLTEDMGKTRQEVDDAIVNYNMRSPSHVNTRRLTQTERRNRFESPNRRMASRMRQEIASRRGRDVLGGGQSVSSLPTLAEVRAAADASPVAPMQSLY